MGAVGLLFDMTLAKLSLIFARYFPWSFNSSCFFLVLLFHLTTGVSYTDAARSLDDFSIHLTAKTPTLAY